MIREGDGKNMKATDSSPVDTEQRADGTVRNQTTMGSEKKFPWVTIVVVLVLLIIIGTMLSTIQIGSGAE